MRQRTTTWTDVNSQLDDFLDDAESDEEGIDQDYSQTLRISAWNWGQRLLALHTPRERMATLTIATDGRSAILPEDFMAVRRIYDSDGEIWIDRVKEQKGKRLTDEDLDLYWVWGNVLRFEKSYALTSEDLALYYWAYWAEVEMETVGASAVYVQEAISVPPWAILPLCHLTAATCLMPGALKAAKINDYNIRVDSGRPTDNSREVQARAHWWWWTELLNRIKPKDWRQ